MWCSGYLDLKNDEMEGRAAAAHLTYLREDLVSRLSKKKAKAPFHLEQQHSFITFDCG